MVDRGTLYQADFRIKNDAKANSVTKAEEDATESQFSSDRGTNHELHLYLSPATPSHKVPINKATCSMSSYQHDESDHFVETSPVSMAYADSEQSQAP